MNTLHFPLQKTGLILSSLFLLLFIPINQINSQGFFESPISDPYDIGLSSSQFDDMPFVCLVDIDSDNDQDLFVNRMAFVADCWESISLDFYENVGTEGCPDFVFIQSQPLGLPAELGYPTFVDIDGDGDLDMFSNDWCLSSTFFYCENTGTAEEPDFDGITETGNPFGINPTDIEFAHLRFYDMDADGDFDAFINGRKTPSFRYQENIGSAAEPVFAAVETDPFGLEIPGEFGPDWGVCVDWDCDGDLDMLHGHSPINSITQWDVYLYENIGSPTTPDFDQPIFTGNDFMPMTVADLDADGDIDVLSYELFYENVTQNPGCVNLPAAGFTFVQNYQYLEFTDISTVKATDCAPVSWLWEFGDGAISEEQNPFHAFTENGTYNVCLTVEDVAGQNVYCEDVSITVSNVQEQLFEEYFSLYPNPAGDFIYLELKQDENIKTMQIELIDHFGKKIEGENLKYFTIDNLSIKIYLKDLPTGHYILMVRNGDQIFSTRFLRI